MNSISYYYEDWISLKEYIIGSTDTLFIDDNSTSIA